MATPRVPLAQAQDKRRLSSVPFVPDTFFDTFFCNGIVLQTRHAFFGVEAALICRRGFGVNAKHIIQLTEI
jgi:hypothetical protein